MKIKGAIFDMDGTLINSLIFWDLFWEDIGRKFLNRENFRPSEENDKKVRTMTMKDAMYLIHDVYNIAKDGDELCEYAENALKDFYASKVEAKSGVIDFLEYCVNNGVKMCIASASDGQLLEVALKRCSLDKYFGKIISCAQIGKGKDHPDVYIKALEYLGTPKEETWVFEDSAVALSTAHDFGFPTVGIYDKFNYGHDVLKSKSSIYIDDGETLMKLTDGDE